MEVIGAILFIIFILGLPVYTIIDAIRCRNCKWYEVTVNEDGYILKKKVLTKLSKDEIVQHLESKGWFTDISCIEIR